MAPLRMLMIVVAIFGLHNFVSNSVPGGVSARRPQITKEQLSRAGIIPDVVPAVSLDTNLSLRVKYPAAEVNAGNLLSMNATAAKPAVTISCKSGTCGAMSKTYYSLLMVDPDAPSPDQPSARNFWHWGIVNATSTDFASGIAVMPYAGPAPPRGEHRYVLLLFRQKHVISAPKENPDNRANFDVTKYTTARGLGTPVAVNWFTVRPAKS